MSDCGGEQDFLDASACLRMQVQISAAKIWLRRAVVRFFDMPEAELVALILDRFESIGVIGDPF